MARRRTVPSSRVTARIGAPAGTVGRRHLLVGWLAILALLIQVAVPDLAMAARARLPAGILAAATEADHCGAPLQEAQAGWEHDAPRSVAGDGAPADHERPAAPAMEHDGLCAFCLALGVHGLVPVTTAVRPKAVFRMEFAAPASTVVRPADHFLTCLNPRAPPV
nr:DUF2946 family protein [Azospirillum sp. 412522]